MVQYSINQIFNFKPKNMKNYQSSFQWVQTWARKENLNQEFLTKISQNVYKLINRISKRRNPKNS